MSDRLDPGDYLVRIVGDSQSDSSPIRAFARGIVEPWEAEGMDAFVRCCRAATARGRRVRRVFEDNGLYRERVREPQLRSLDRGILGPDHRPGSIVVEPSPGTST